MSDLRMQRPRLARCVIALRLENKFEFLQKANGSQMSS